MEANAVVLVKSARVQVRRAKVLISTLDRVVQLFLSKISLFDAACIPTPHDAEGAPDPTLSIAAVKKVKGLIDHPSPHILPSIWP
jgi:hypothetical protein